YGPLSAAVTSNVGNGSIDASGAGAGGPHTWFGNDGVYIDGQTQVTWCDGRLDSSTVGGGLVDGNAGLGYAASLETGKQIPLSAFWSTTPQAQLVYSSVEFDSFTDAFGTSVSGGSSDSLVGRLGITLDRQAEWQGSNGGTSRSHLYGIANLYYDFD